MARKARQTFLHPADAYFREQSARCLAIARVRPLPREQADLLRLAAYASDVEDATDVEDTGSFTVVLR